MKNRYWRSASCLYGFAWTGPILKPPHTWNSKYTCERQCQLWILLFHIPCDLAVFISFRLLCTVSAVNNRCHRDEYSRLMFFPVEGAWSWTGSDCKSTPNILFLLDCIPVKSLCFFYWIGDGIAPELEAVFLQRTELYWTSRGAHTGRVFQCCVWGYTGGNHCHTFVICIRPFSSSCLHGHNLCSMHKTAGQRSHRWYLNAIRGLSFNPWTWKSMYRVQHTHLIT